VNLDAARRELQKKELNERRAACENLHRAVMSDDEDLLQRAIGEAKRCAVEGDDVEKAEAVLQELLEQTDEQRAAKVARKLEVEAKKKAFLCLKRDDAAALRKLLLGLGEDVVWQDWRDTAGRNLWRFSQEMNSQKCQDLLRELLGLPAPHMKNNARSSRSLSSAPAEQPVSKPEVELKLVDDAKSSVDDVPSGPVEKREKRLDEQSVQGTASEADSSLSIDEIKRLQTVAQRAVAHDDAPALNAVIDRVPVAIWSRWTNKAGVDLITLAESRGSSAAYAVLGTALGLISQQVREAFAEDETVWIYFPGNVQPKQATVKEDTSPDSNEVLVEIWDEDGDPRRVDRAIVFKSQRV
jgi:hypothetical protein